jgi:hypothetical protein
LVPVDIASDLHIDNEHLYRPRFLSRASFSP